MKLLFFTCETSGLEPATSEILSWEYARWDASQSTPAGPVTRDVFRMLGSPAAAADALRANGYDASKAHEHPPLQHGFVERVLSEIDACDGVVAAVNPRFYVSHLDEACRRLGIRVPFMRVVDVASLCVPLFVAGKTKSLGLAALADGLGIQPGSKVERTMGVFEACFKKYYGALK